MALDKPSKIALLIAAISALFTFGAAVWSATSVPRINVVEHIAEDHENRLRALEAKTTETNTHVQWLRDFFDPDWKRGDPAQ